MRVLLTSLLAFVMAACATGGEVMKVEEDLAYRLAAGDGVMVTIFAEPDLTGPYRINELGTLELPLAGAIQAAGLTTDELQTKIREAYLGRYLQDPRVSVEVSDPRPVYILGEVNQPGEYEYGEAMTVMQAVAKAGGFTYRANRSVFYVLHHAGEEEKKYKLTPTTMLQPGDTIRIVQRFF